MCGRATNADYLAYQYGDAAKLRIRQDTHARYSENPTGLIAWLLPHIAPGPGLSVLDVGSGPGLFHGPLCERGCRVVAVDLSLGMVREARAHAAAHGLEAAAVQADAQCLPLRDGSFDRVMANHMLYHVPDRPAALREMRRVLKPGGRAVLATNAADIYQRLADLHNRAASQLGYTYGPSMAARFSLDDLPLVQTIFPAAELHTMEDALVFPDAASALRYYASSSIDRIDDRPADGRHREQLLPLVEAQIRDIISREGVFRVPKQVGCFVAQVPRS